MPNEIRLGTSHTADARKAMQSVSVVTKIAEMARRYAHRIRSRIELRCDGGASHADCVKASRRMKRSSQPMPRMT